jgi:chromosomal replication initiator protein
VDKVVRNSLASNLERTWERVLECVAQRIKPDDLNLIRPLRLRALTSTEVRLEAPNKLALVCITESYLPALRDAVESVVGRRQVQIDLPRRDQGELFPRSVPRGSRRAKGTDTNLIPKYTFANFVVGASNQFAHAACRAVSTQPGDHYNPLFIYGGVGLGKTHLVNAVGHEVLRQRTGACIAYLSSEAFMTDLISSLRRDRMADFKDRFRRVDVLILDDVQLLAGRERTQEEFFHTFNTLYDQRRQIVLTSDKVPKDIPDLEERLRNRFEWGLIADIQPPDVETRVAIVEKKAELEGIPIDPEVAMFLATNVASNVRELEGSLTRIGAYASLRRRPITVDFARDVLQSVLRPQYSAITFDAIAGAVCDHFSLRPNDLRSKRRSKNVSVPRQLAMYLCRQMMSASFPQIGQMFGRDHSTVIHATTVTRRRIKDDPAFHAMVERIERSIRGQ